MVTKRIFVSDIHMGDERSTSQPSPLHNYCWFHDSESASEPDRPEMLTKFLEEYCAGDASINEVVVVGDLFDEWVCPAQFDPTEPPCPVPLPQGEQYRKIASAPQNLPVIEALKKLASQKRLVYVPGNHDMFADGPIVSEMFPGIRCPKPVDGHCVYRADGIWAEHGHWYGMFNAPHPAGAAGGLSASRLPLGYFISRIDAEETLRTGKGFSLPQVFKEWIEHILYRVPQARDSKAIAGDLVDDVLMDLFDTLVSDHAYGLKGAVMNGFAGIPGITPWEEVKKRYAHVYAQWSTNHPNNVRPLDAIQCDAGSLWEAARMVTFTNDDVRIVICGHTHESTFESYPIDISDDTIISPEANRIYANSGAWTNDTVTCTFVETELRPDEKMHLVSLKEWIKDPLIGDYKAKDVWRQNGWVVP
ncbi:MAG TPA: metallophosphoesterase [Syntrophorhabdaceae bacterium]|nr:metallophosphoesterase [Syntrophorhabdaceae bacterium]